MPTFLNQEETNAIPADLQEFIDANSGRKSPDTPEQIAQQEAYWERYGLRDENGNRVPGVNQELLKQDYEVLRNTYGEGSFLSNFISLAAPLVMMAVPGIGTMIGSTLTGALGIPASAAINGLIGNTVLNTVLNGGDLEKAVKSSVGQWAGAEVGSIVGKSAAEMFGSADAGKFIGNIASAGTRAVIGGQDLSQALTGAALSGAVDFATSKIPGFSDLKPAVKNAITSSISTALQGGNVDFSKILENATKEGFLSYGLSQIPDFDKASPSAQSFITTMLRTGINNGDMSQAALNWAINQASTEFTNSVKTAPALEELKKSGFIDSDNYFKLNDDQKALVNRFSDAKDPRAAAAEYINRNSTTAEEIENYYKSITGQTTIPDDVKDLLKTYQGARLDEDTAFTGLRNQLDVMAAADRMKLEKLNEGFANLKYDDRALADTMREFGITPTFIEKVTGKKYQDIVDNLNARVMHDDEVAANFKDVFGRDATDAEIKKYAGLSAYAAKPQMQVDADVEATTFNAKDYEDPKEAAKAAKAAGYNNFVMPDGKTYVIQSPVNEGQAKDDIKAAATFGEAFAQAREKLGAGKTFEWNGKLYSTNVAAEAPYDGSRAASMTDAALLANQAGKNLFTFDGKTYKIPAGALDNIGNQSLAETKRLLGDQVKYATDAELAATGLQSKSLTQKLGDQDTVSGKFANLMGIGAKALGGQMQSFANAYSTATGTSYDNVVSNLGKSIENIGDALVGRDITLEKKNVQNVLNSLGDKDWKDIPSTVWKSIADNKAGFVASVLEEGYQELLPMAAGFGAGKLVSGLLNKGIAASLLSGSTAAAAVDATLNGVESFGSGAKDAYDEVMSKMPANATAEQAQEVLQRARDAAVKNGTIHALVEIPSEFLADKLLFKSYMEGFVKQGLGSLAVNYGSATTAGFLSELIAGFSQNLSTKLTTSAAPLTQADLKSAFGAGLYEGSIGAAVSGGILSPSAIKDAVVIGKDYAGNNVTFGEFISGAKDVDLKTLDPNAVVATNNQGQPVTLSGLTITAAGSDAFSNDLKAILPASLTTNNTTVVGKDSGGNDITYGDIVSGKVQGTGTATSSVIRDYVSSGMSAPVNATNVTTPKTAITNIVAANPGLTATDVQNIVDLTLSQVPAGITNAQVQDIVKSAVSNLPVGATAAEVQNAITNATSNFVTMTDVQNAIAGIQFPAGLKKEDVVAAIQDYMKANPGVSLSDVAEKITDATKGLATTDAVKTSISDALKGYATKSDIDAAIAGIQFPAGLKKEDVTAAITDYMKANPGLTMADVVANISDATKNLATNDSVRASIADALGGYATKADINAAIAGIQFPAGITKADVAAGIADYMKANPGLSAADVTAEIAAYMKANPPVTKDDIALAVRTSGDSFQAKLNETQAALQEEIARNEAAGMSRDVALQRAIDTVAAAQKTTTQKLISSIGAVKTDLGKEISGLKSDLAQTERDILAEVRKNEAAGLSRDAALQKAINTVAAKQNTSTAALTSKINTVETNLGNEITALQSDLAQTERDILSQVAKNEAAGMSRDAALQKAIDTVAASQKKSSADILAKLNTTSTTLNSRITSLQSELANTEQSILAEVARNEAAGMSRDVALQKAIDKVAATQKTSTAALTNRLSNLETNLGREIGAQVASLNTKLSAEIQAAIDLGLEGDAALQKAIESLANKVGVNQTTLLNTLNKTTASLKTEFTNKLTSLDAKLSAAIADAKATGLKGDEALRAAINKVAAEQKTTATDLLATIGKTEASLKSQFSSEIGEVKADIAAINTSLSEAIAEARREGLQGDAALQKAITTVSENLGIARTELLSEIGKTEENLKTEFRNELTTVRTDIDSRISQLRQEGLDLNTATRQALEEFKGTVSTGFSEVDTRIGELMLQGQTYQEATTNALKELGGTVKGIQTSQQQAADQAAFQAATQKAMNIIGQPEVIAAPQPLSPLKQITTGGAAAVFSGPLQDYLKTVQTGYLPQHTTQQSKPEQQSMQSDYFNYGQSSDIGDLLNTQDEESETQYAAAGGIMSTPLMAAGGGTRYGKFAGGGLNVVHHSGKARVDFRHGDAVRGPGDGQSDDIPAMLADGEFVFPADVVSALGNGSTKAGSDKLYKMMHSIRAYHRSAKPKDLPPPAKKSPLDYLKKSRS